MSSIYEQVQSAVTLLDYLNHIGNPITEAELPRNISCPLHTDRKPSLRLYAPAHRGGYCFSCGKSYTAITMHQSLRGITAREALQELMDIFSLQSLDTQEQQEQQPQVSNAELATKIKEHILPIMHSNPDKIHRNFKVFENKLYRAINTGTTEGLQ